MASFVPPIDTLVLFGHTGAAQAAQLPPGCQAMTLPALCRALDEPWVTPGARWRSADITQTQLLCSEAVQEALGSGYDAFDPRLAKQTLSALTELRQAGVTATHLRKVAAHGPKRAAKAHEDAHLQALAQLLTAYTDKLEARCWLDPADAWRRAVLRVAQGRLPQAFAALQTVRVAIGCDVYAGALDLLQAFAARGIAVHMHMRLDSQRPAAFAWSVALLCGVEARTEAGIQLHFDDGIGSGPLAALRAGLDAEVLPDAATAELDAVPFAARTVANGDSLIEAATAWAAGHVQRGVPAESLAIVMPRAQGDAWRPQAIAQQLCSALRGSGIPVGEQPRHSVVDSPLGRLMRAALVVCGAAAAAAGKKQAEPSMPAMLLADVLFGLGAAAGLDAAQRQRGAALLRRLGSRRMPLARLLAMLDRLDGGDKEQRAQSKDHIRQFVQQVLAPMVQTQSLLQASMAFDDWLQAACLAQPLWVNDAEALSDNLAALARAAAALTPAMQWPHIGAWLADVLARTQQRVGRADAGVLLCAPEDLCGRPFAHVLLLAANQGIFPRGLPVDGILTAGVRTRINHALGPKLLSYAPLFARQEPAFSARERWLFYEMLVAAQQSFVAVVLRAADDDDQGASERVMAALAALGRAGPDVADWQPQAEPTPRSWLRQQAQLQPWDAAQIPDALPHDAAAQLASLHARLQHSAVVQQGAPKLAAATAVQVQQQLLSTSQAASGLDVLGMCRFRFFAERIMALQAPGFAAFDQDPRARGTAQHRALHRVLAAWRAAPGGLPALRREPEQAWQLARSVFASLHTLLVPEHSVEPSLRAASIGLAWQAVQAQLSRDLSDPTIEPLALEYSFGGSSPHSAQALRLPHPQRPDWLLQVRGSIDRVDRRGQTLWTLDYKSTLLPRAEDRHLQLGLYSLVAARDFWPQAPEQQAAWLQLGHTAPGQPVQKAAKGLQPAPAALAEQIAARTWERLAPLLDGDVAPDPEKAEICQRCSFAPLCRHSAISAADADAAQEATDV